MTRFAWIVALLVPFAVACKKRPPARDSASKPAAAAPAPAPAPAPKPAAAAKVGGEKTLDATATAKASRVVMETTLGNITIQLFPKKAPIGAKNFLAYARSGAYNGTIFHRVKPGFVIQGGGFEPGMKKRPTRDPIRNEADNGVKNKRGTLCWARTPNPHSATNQFFINLKYNRALDHRAKTRFGWGYAVFGKVVKGMNVVDKIAAVQTTTKGMYSDVPVTPVIIKKVRVIAKK